MAEARMIEMMAKKYDEILARAESARCAAAAAVFRETVDQGHSDDVAFQRALKHFLSAAGDEDRRA